MSEVSAQSNERREVAPDVAAQFLETSVAHILELVKLGALRARVDGEVQLIGVDDLEAFAHEQARRRPFMEEIGRVGAEQMENERRRDLIASPGPYSC